MSRAMFKHPITFYKITFNQDLSGSMIKDEGDKICTKCKINNNYRNRGNENGDIDYLFNKSVDINDYICVDGYDEFSLCNKKYKIISITNNEDWKTKTIIGEQIND